MWKERRKIENEETKKLHCCNCGELIDRDVSTCPICKFDFNEGVEDEVNNSYNTDNSNVLNAIQIFSIIYCILGFIGMFYLSSKLDLIGINFISVLFVTGPSLLFFTVLIFSFGTLCEDVKSIKNYAEKLER